MAVELADLVDSLDVVLNTPGDAAGQLFTVVGAEDAWTLALANGFWTAHRRGFYTDFRVDADTFEIVNIAVGGTDMSREDQQVIVLWTARTAVRSKLLTMFSHAKDEGGGALTERDRSSTLLKALLDSIDTELELIRDEAVGGSSTTTVRVIDAILQSSGIPSGARLNRPFVN